MSTFMLVCCSFAFAAFLHVTYSRLSILKDAAHSRHIQPCTRCYTARCYFSATLTGTMAAAIKGKRFVHRRMPTLFIASDLSIPFWPPMYMGLHWENAFLAGNVVNTFRTSFNNSDMGHFSCVSLEALITVGGVQNSRKRKREQSGALCLPLPDHSKLLYKDILGWVSAVEPHS